ncbi:MAG: TetR/AcrR family transcriptional regulator [Bacteroidota bacterium]
MNPSPKPAQRGKARPRAAAGDPVTKTNGRRVASQQRRQAILHAALHIFAENGFAAARLDDVAARAGIAKGTLYLYFADKEALFEELIRSYMSPILDKLEATSAAAAPLPAPLLLQQLFELFRREVLETERKHIIQLLISEGPRFPALAEFYFREIVSRGIRALGGLARQAQASGQLPSNALARYPQLIVAPLLVAVVWDRLFSRFEPLDVDGMLKAHAMLLTGGKTPS